MARLPVFSETLEAVALAARAGAEQAVVSDANTVSAAQPKHRDWVSDLFCEILYTVTFEE